MKSFRKEWTCRELCGRTWIVASLLGAGAISGCGIGNPAEVTVDTVVPADASIQGSNYGGHAPITGAEVFVLEATSTGYAAKAKSLLTSVSHSASYPTAQDTSGGVTNGLYYVTTDSTGSFNITGDYTCDVGQPVYLYAAGGNPATNPAVQISQAVVSGTGPYTITFTTGGQLLYSGESVKFTGSTSTFGKYINGQTLTVLSNVNLTTTTFQVQVSSLTSGGNSVTATTYAGLSGVSAAQASAPSNPAIVNMAMLGLCPSTGNFTTALSFVYMNEVSTVAMAYAMAGFSTDSLHIGGYATNLNGLQNAALNAANLYNIQGGVIGGAGDGESHIANATAPNATAGTVPQAEINTLANIVANCVDSANTSVGTSVAALAAESVQCSLLMENTTNNGIPYPSSGYGTIPIDTATSMINLAHYPAGINSHPANSYVDSAIPSTLFNLPTSNVPFTPQLSTAPTDWTIALTYKNIPTPSALAIDANGNAYVGTYSTLAGYITELSSQGTVLATSTVPVSNLFGIAISPTVAGAYTVWATSNLSNGIYKFSSSLATSSLYASIYTAKPSALAIDTAGNVYVSNNSSSYPYQYLSEFNSAGTLINTPYTTNGAIPYANGMALATSGSVWLSQTNNDLGLYANPSTGNTNTLTSGGTNNISAIAVDYQGYAWATAKNGSGGNQDLIRTASPTNASTLTSYGVCGYNNCSVGGLNNPVAVAVDGSNASNGNTFNVWVANSGNNTVTEVNSSSTGNSLSSSAGYQSGTGSVNTPSAIAVDNAGNVWIANQGNSTVTEIIGSANPVSTPFSTQKPGVEP